VTATAGLWPPALALHQVSKVYPPRRAWWWPPKTLGEPVTAVNELSLEVPPGVVFGLLGPNGSGKTTTINLITGLARATAGRVEVAGLDVRRHRREVLARLGTVPQETALLDDLTARDNLTFHAGLYLPGVPRRERAARIDAQLELAGLTERQSSRVGTFSGGMKRRLAIARQMMHDPELLILDEPTLGVDPQQCLIIWAYIRELATDRGKTVLVTTNNLAEAEALCDQVAIIDHGRLVTIGTPRGLRLTHGTTVLSVQLRTAGGVPGPALEALRQVTGVTGVTSQAHPTLGGTYTLTVTARGGSPAAAIATAVNGHGDLLDLTVREARLDEAFIALTGAATRD